MNGKEAVLSAFDRLFDRAAAKLKLEYEPEDKAEARELFAQRFKAASMLPISSIWKRSPKK